MRFRVVCGFEVTIAIFCPTSRFTNVDFPAFGRPTIATKPALQPAAMEVSVRVGADTTLSVSVVPAIFLAVIEFLRSNHHQFPIPRRPNRIFRRPAASAHGVFESKFDLPETTKTIHRLGATTWLS